MDSEDLYSSRAMSKQIKASLSKEIVDFELEVLSEIDRIVYCPEGIGRRNPLGIFAALWVLILAYQEHMMYLTYSQRTGRILCFI